MSAKRSNELSSQRWYLVLAPIITALLITVTVDSRLGTRLENVVRDGMFRLRQQADPEVSPELMVVAITEDDLVKYGRWPWSRNVHADFFSLAAQKPPAVLAFDILFTEREGNGDNDMNLSMAAFGMENSILGAMISRRSEAAVHGDGDGVDVSSVNESDFGITAPLGRVEGDLDQMAYQGQRAALPVTELINTSYVGFVDSAPAFDGIKRSVPLVVRIGDEVYPTLVTQMMMRYWNLGSDQVLVRLGDYVEFAAAAGTRRVPIDERGLLQINWRNQDRFLTGNAAFSYGNFLYPLRAFAEGQPWPVNAPSPEGKIVLVGQANTEGMTDIGPTPLHPSTALLLLHVNALDNILKSDYLRLIPFRSTLPVWLLVAWLSLLVVGRTNLWVSILVPVILVLTYVAAAYLWFHRSSVSLPVVLPSMGFIFALHGGHVLLRWRSDRRGRAELKSMFSSYLGPRVMNELMSHPSKINLGGERKPVTIMFSDVRDFTALSEAMTEEALVTHLNEYFETMVDCVNRFRGTLHKYIGDAIMVVWGDVAWEGVNSMSPAESAENAVRSSLSMLAELEKLNQRWKKEERMPLKIGIGLNFGEVLVGNIGASQRMEFTVIGDAVNVASRLEGQCKTYRSELVIGEPVRELLGPEFIVRSLGLLVLKGKTRPIRASEVLAVESEGNELTELRAWVDHYEEGYAAYLDRRFKDAAAIFEASLKVRPTDFCSGNYLRISQDFVRQPPPPEWNGVEVLLEK